MIYKKSNWKNSRRQSRDDHYWDYANNWELEDLLKYLDECGISVERSGDKFQLRHPPGFTIPELKMAEIKSHKMALMILYEFEGTTIE